VKKSRLLLILLAVLLVSSSLTQVKCISLEKTEFKPFEQVNVRINHVSSWTRPVDVTVLLDGYPVTVAVYDAGSDLYVSFIMPAGKPADLSLRVFAKDANQTNLADSTRTIKRVESNETAQMIEVLKENVTQLMGNVSRLAEKVSALENITSSLNPQLDALQQKLNDLQSQVNNTLITAVNNAAFELKQELNAVHEELVTLKTDTADMKTLASMINDAASTGNAAASNVQMQLNDLHNTVYAALGLSAVTAVAAASSLVVSVHRRKRSRGIKPQKEKKPSLKEEANLEKLMFYPENGGFEEEETPEEDEDRIITRVIKPKKLSELTRVNSENQSSREIQPDIELLERLPYAPKTKTYMIARRILEGEEDVDRIAREFGVKKKTVYNVKSRINTLLQQKYTISGVAPWKKEEEKQNDGS